MHDGYIAKLNFGLELPGTSEGQQNVTWRGPRCGLLASRALGAHPSPRSSQRLRWAFLAEVPLNETGARPLAEKPLPSGLDLRSILDFLHLMPVS